jgi:hypothetical protein
MRDIHASLFDMLATAALSAQQTSHHDAWLQHSHEQLQNDQQSAPPGWLPDMSCQQLMFHTRNVQW